VHAEKVGAEFKNGNSGKISVREGESGFCMWDWRGRCSASRKSKPLTYQRKLSALN